MFAHPVSISEILLILFVVLLLFGGKKVPELARALGRSIAEFKKGQAEGIVPSEPNKNESKPDGTKT